MKKELPRSIEKDILLSSLQTNLIQNLSDEAS